MPELRTRLLEQITAGLTVLNGAIATRVGRRPDDFAVQVWSGAEHVEGGDDLAQVGRGRSHR